MCKCGKPEPVIESTKYRMRTAAYQHAENVGIRFANMPDVVLQAFASGVTCGLTGACEVTVELMRERGL